MKLLDTLLNSWLQPRDTVCNGQVPTRAQLPFIYLNNFI